MELESNVRRTDGFPPNDSVPAETTASGRRPLAVPTEQLKGSIEFIGLPGAGKSWLCQRLREIQLDRQEAGSGAVGFSPMKERPWVDAQLIKGVWAFGIAFRHPVLTVRLVGMVRRSGQRSKIDAFTKTINLLAELGRVTFARRLFFTDQGVLQAVWSLSLRARNPATQSLLESVNPWLPSTVVRVEVAPAENSRRLDGREHGKSRLDKASLKQRVLEFERGAALFADILKYWENLDGERKLLEVTNSRDSDPGEILAEVIAAIGKPA